MAINNITITLTSSSSSSRLLHNLTRKPIPTKHRRINSKTKPATISMASVSTKVIPSVIVGGGRVGRALQEMGNGRDLVVRRGQAVPLDFEGPILVCTRNDDLEAVLEATPRSRWNGTTS